MNNLDKTKLLIDHKYDLKQKRHFLNGFQTVFHCHHYTTLYTQLAMDAGETKLFEDVAEDSLYEMIMTCLEQAKDTIDDKISIATQLYGALGLGKLEVVFLGNDSGEVKSPFSHIDTGWIKKWGKFDKPVNFIGKGFISALFSAVLNKPTGTFSVLETKSIVMGDEYSYFKVFKK